MNRRKSQAWPPSFCQKARGHGIVACDRRAVRPLLTRASKRWRAERVETELELHKHECAASFSHASVVTSAEAPARTALPLFDETDRPRPRRQRQGWRC